MSAGAGRGPHANVQMRRPARIGHGPDRLERVAAVAVRHRDAVALEVVVARNAVVAGVVIAAVDVALPELDGRSRRAGRPSRVSARPAKIERRALGLGRAAGDLREVGVALGGKGPRIERPLGLARRRDQRRRLRTERVERKERAATSAPQARRRPATGRRRLTDGAEPPLQGHRGGTIGTVAHVGSDQAARIARRRSAVVGWMTVAPKPRTFARSCKC